MSNHCTIRMSDEEKAVIAACKNCKIIVERNDFAAKLREIEKWMTPPIPETDPYMNARDFLARFFPEVKPSPCGDHVECGGCINKEDCEVKP